MLKIMSEFMDILTKRVGPGYARAVLPPYHWCFIEEAAAVLLGQEGAVPGRWVGFCREYDHMLWGVENRNYKCVAHHGSRENKSHVIFVYEYRKYSIYFPDVDVLIELN